MSRSCGSGTSSRGDQPGADRAERVGALALHPLAGAFESGRRAPTHRSRHSSRRRASSRRPRTRYLRRRADDHAELDLPVGLLGAARDHDVVVGADDRVVAFEKTMGSSAPGAGLRGVIGVVQADADELADPADARPEAGWPSTIGSEAGSSARGRRSSETASGRRRPYRAPARQITQPPLCIEQPGLLLARRAIPQQLHACLLCRDATMSRECPDRVIRGVSAGARRPDGKARRGRIFGHIRPRSNAASGDAPPGDYSANGAVRTRNNTRRPAGTHPRCARTRFGIARYRVGNRRFSSAILGRSLIAM